MFRDLLQPTITNDRNFSSSNLLELSNQIVLVLYSFDTYISLYAKQHFLVKLIIFRHITCIMHFCTVLHVSDVKWQVDELLEAQGLFKCTCWQHMT